MNLARTTSFWVRTLAVWGIVGLILFQAPPVFWAEETPPSQPSSPSSSDETPVPAPPEEKPNEILAIQVRGNQIISTAVVLNQMRSRKGERLVRETVNEDIKRLYGTGYFRDIQIEVEEDPQGFRLIVSVEEKPIVRQIILDGHSTFDEKDLRKEIKILEGQILDERALKEGVEAIRKKYGSKGFRFVEIESEVDVNEKTKEATVFIHILEGEKYKIKDVRFDGVQAFKLKKIRKLMKTKKDTWITSGVFNEEKFQKDLDRIQLFYQQEGYLDVKVSPKFDYDAANRKIVITILIEEGTHYVTGEVKIEGAELFPESEIWETLEMLPGTTYSQYYLANDLDRIRRYYFERGYVDARIVPDVKLNRDTGKVDLRYRIKEGDLYFVDKVVIRGNKKTKDIVVRRELRIRPGDKIDGEKIRKSVQRLEDLEYFEEVTHDFEPGSAANRKDLVFRVKEKRTGELSFGGGVSSIDRFVGFAEISQKNFDLLNFPRFTGAGQKLSVRARVGTIAQNYEVNFVEPYLFGRKISLGVEGYNTRRDNLNVDFDESRLGFGVNLSKAFGDTFRLGTGYTLESIKLDNISSDAPKVVRDFEGSTTLSRFRLSQNWDTRDSMINPGRGLLFSLQEELVGSFIGGEEDFYTLQANYTHYWTLFKKHVIEFRFRIGTSQDFGDSDTVPVFDRFYAGGLGTVRGFNYRRVGPLEAGDAVGGQTLNVINLEYTFPLPYLEILKAAVFVDVGQVHEDSYGLDFGDYAISVGPGIKVKTPIGPLAFYYGLPIANRDTEDRNGRFEFSLSHGF
ncbi:MAG: outer membrane protein assembly factor BamA [Candidatus Omnitrophica bacterium]|nr:outer membrane protein assembly factor BamA [Candidatus Omnitrophota bacterium]